MNGSSVNLLNSANLAKSIEVHYTGYLSYLCLCGCGVTFWPFTQYVASLNNSFNCNWSLNLVKQFRKRSSISKILIYTVLIVVVGLYGNLSQTPARICLCEITRTQREITEMIQGVFILWSTHQTTVSWDTRFEMVYLYGSSPLPPWISPEWLATMAFNGISNNNTGISDLKWSRARKIVSSPKSHIQSYILFGFTGHGVLTNPGSTTEGWLLPVGSFG